jgi:hypothetical protein
VARRFERSSPRDAPIVAHLRCSVACRESRFPAGEAPQLYHVVAFVLVLAGIVVSSRQ